jgi:hypothetical protein
MICFALALNLKLAAGNENGDGDFLEIPPGVLRPGGVDRCKEGQEAWLGALGVLL